MSLERARQALDGLSVGDSLGEQFFGWEDQVVPRIEARIVPEPRWRYTDDTEMALSLFAILRDWGEINQDKLAVAFCCRYSPHRGYGGGARQLLEEIGRTHASAWRTLAPAMFGGCGSFGNGAAMRVAPLGAFFCNDYAKAARQAELSAEITHANPEGIAGAVAVAVAAAWMNRDQPWDRDAFFATVLEHTPAGKTCEGIVRAHGLGMEMSGRGAAAILGSGHEISAQDTVPFALWSASVEPTDFAGTFWRTVEGLGDRDTTCAIACGVVAARAPLPEGWLESREALPPGF